METCETKAPTTSGTVRVLIADDSDEDRTLFRHILRTFDDFEVIGTTVDGADTIAYFKGLRPYDTPGLRRDPDLILLDFQMPRLSGLDVLRTLQAETRGRKVILWSDAPELINRQSAYRFGASLVCGKPQRRADLVKILTQAFMKGSWRATRTVSDILGNEGKSPREQHIRSF
jgi:DNA-binding NarL/FixJ family response regulator